MLNYLKNTLDMKLPIDLKDRPLSYSSMKHFRQSPKHYVHYITEPRKPPTPEMILGNGFERKLYSIAFNDPEIFDNAVFIYQKPNLRTNQGKAEWEQILVAGEGKIMLEEEQLATINRMAVEFQNYPDMVQHVMGFKKQQTKLLWTDKKADIPFIGYTDAEGDAFGNDWVYDIKVSKDADPDDWQRAAFNWEYHIQMATYAEGYHRTQFRFPDFAWLVFDPNPPYNCSIIYLESKVLEEAREEWRATVDAFRFCIDNELFHQGYEFRLQTMPYFSLRKPGYYKPKFMPEQ